MGLEKEFERRGNWLFRWRSYLPLFVLGIVLTGFRHYHYLEESSFYDGLWEGVCFGFAFAGFAIRVYTVGYTPSGTSGRNVANQKADVLNTTGIYSLLRHPLYLGNYLIWFGVSLFVMNAYISLIVLILFWVYYEKIMYAEEAFLKGKFQEQFVQWSSRTPAIVPRFKHWVKPNQSFSLKKVLRREVSTWLGIVCSLALLEVVSSYREEGQWELDFSWIVIVLVSVVAALLIRFLKKKTNLLRD